MFGTQEPLHNTAAMAQPGREGHFPGLSLLGRGLASSFRDKGPVSGVASWSGGRDTQQCPKFAGTCCSRHWVRPTVCLVFSQTHRGRGACYAHFTPERAGSAKLPQSHTAGQGQSRAATSEALWSLRGPLWGKSSMLGGGRVGGLLFSEGGMWFEFESLLPEV